MLVSCFVDEYFSVDANLFLSISKLSKKLFPLAVEDPDLELKGVAVGV